MHVKTRQTTDFQAPAAPFALEQSCSYTLLNTNPTVPSAESPCKQQVIE